MENRDPVLVLRDFRRFVDKIESRSMACDGPVTPFIHELNAAADVEQDQFVSLLSEIYKMEG